LHAPVHCIQLVGTKPRRSMPPGRCARARCCAIVGRWPAGEAVPARSPPQGRRRHCGGSPRRRCRISRPACRTGRDELPLAHARCGCPFYSSATGAAEAAQNSSGPTRSGKSRPVVPRRREKAMSQGAVLVIEDDEAIAALLAEVLTAEGYRVTRVAGPGDALALLTLAGPDAFDVVLSRPF